MPSHVVQVTEPNFVVTYRFETDTSFGGSGVVGLGGILADGVEFAQADNGELLFRSIDFGANGTEDELSRVDANGNVIGQVDLNALINPLLSGLTPATTISIQDIEFDSQNRAVVIGQANHSAFGAGLTSTQDFLIRVNTDGSLDTGLVVIGADEPVGDRFTPVPSRDEILIDSHDRIIVSNATSATRLNPDGSTDTSFGNNGVTDLTVFEGVVDNFSGLEFAPDGSIIILAGRPLSSSSPNAGSLFRLDANGQIDFGFGQGGRADIPLEAFTSSSAVFIVDDFAVDDSGRIVVAGLAEVTRFTADGQIDTSFGDNGTLTVPSNPALNNIDDVAIDSQGNIVLSVGSGTVARINSDGTFDALFGTDGFQNLGDQFLLVEALDFDDADRLIASGSSPSGTALGRFRLV